MDYSKKDLKKVGIKEVLAHPTWRMGKRITVDSATLVNKAFEVIEAHQFFDFPYEKIGIVIHRQSLVHAFTQGHGGLFACIYPTDMKIPISFSLYYPNSNGFCNGMDLEKRFNLSFSPVDLKRFSLLKLILDAAKKGDNSLAILNACDEVAIDYFLKKRIKFTDIHKVMQYMWRHYPSRRIKRVDDVIYWDNWARKKTEEYLDKKC